MAETFYWEQKYHQTRKLYPLCGRRHLRGQLPQCIAANDLSLESPGMTSLVSSVSGIPPAFASIEKRLLTASSGKIFPAIKPFRYGRSNRKMLLEDFFLYYLRPGICILRTVKINTNWQSFTQILLSSSSFIILSPWILLCPLPIKKERGT